MTLRRAQRQRPPAAPVTTHTVRADAFRGGTVERRPITLERHLLLLCGAVPPKSKPYLAFIRKLPCTVDGCPGHGPTRAHHEPPKGMGGRDPEDHNAVPLCEGHHLYRHGDGPPIDGDPPVSVLTEWCEDARLPCILAYHCGPEGPGRKGRT
jgi:hypothetical protein